MNRFAEPARAKRARAALKIAPASHVEFVNNNTSLDVSHFDMEGQE